MHYYENTSFKEKRNFQACKMKVLQSHDLRLSNNVDGSPPMQDNDNDSNIPKSAVLPQGSGHGTSLNSRGVAQHIQARGDSCGYLVQGQDLDFENPCGSLPTQAIRILYFHVRDSHVRKIWENEGLGAHLYCVRTPSVNTNMINDGAKHRIFQSQGKPQGQTIKKTFYSWRELPNIICSRAEAQTYVLGMLCQGRGSLQTTPPPS